MKMNEMITVFLFLITINTNCQSCDSGANITDLDCFNEIKYFEKENRFYRAGHFALNSKGDMIIEYSYNQYRLFYGLTKNGKYYFPEITKEIEIKSNKINPSSLSRFESANLFVSFMDDLNKEKEFLLSISTWTTILELHDLETNNYEISEAVSFFKKIKGIYSFIFQILEMKVNNKIKYFIIYITSEPNYTVDIKEFAFSNFDFGTVVDINQTEISQTENSRITSSFIVDDFNILAVFYMYDFNYLANFYDHDLKLLGTNKIAQYNDGLMGLGIFFKAIYLYERYIAFIYYENFHNFKFKIFYLNENYTLTTLSSYIDNANNLSSIIRMNDFVKIDNNRLVYLSAQDAPNTGLLYIIFFDLYNDYQYKKVRYYKYNFNSPKFFKFTMEIAAIIYNGFLALTATVLYQGVNENYTFPILLMFGYANGTDLEIDISNFLMDIENYNESYNLYKYLIHTMKIDNNVFGYEKVEQIKLDSIPEEIIFLNRNDNSIISNDNFIDENYILKQNDNIIKDDSYYNLEYQFILKEPDYDIFYSSYLDQLKGDDINLNEYFTPRKFYGRANNLKFKLCHKFCKSCKKMGINDNDQKCESCLEEYSFFNNYESQNLQCIPEGHFFDEGKKTIEQCTNENSKFFIDINNNKRICIKSNLECPADYHNYDQITKECKYSRQNFIIYTNEEINKKIDTEILMNYTVEDESIELKGENNTIFQLTTTSNELNRIQGNSSNKNGLSVIDLGTCEATLKAYYNIAQNTSLIIKKYEQLTVASERNVQYEIYHPITKEKLNLSLCQSDTIYLYIPVDLDEELFVLYEDLQNYGYDLFNINDQFYTDICAPYSSEDGTDVLLSDRINYYYNGTYTTCQSNCGYSSFNLQNEYLICECKIIAEDIDINDFSKFSKRFYKNFYDILKYSNYKTLKCYKLVFNLNYLKKNIGSFIVIFFFIGFLCCLIIFIFKRINPLLRDITKIVFINFKNVNKVNLEKISNNKNVIVFNKFEKQNIINSPPKKLKSSKIPSDGDKEKKIRPRKAKKTQIVSNNIQNSLNIDKSSSNDKKDILIESKKNVFEDTEIKNKKTNKKPIRKINSDNTNKTIKSHVLSMKENLDDLDLKYIPYEKAFELDKRKFVQIYWSKLKSNHLIIFTFFSWNDYNLLYIKVSRFLFIICTSMAMNVLFFVDSTMHKIYIDYGKYNFIAQIPQIIYSSVVSLITEILIGILTYTDKNIYEVRQLKEYSYDNINKIIKSIKIKLIIYFVITFIFFLFYWYYISSFCAVYNNTQIIYIKDFASSFCLGLLYPLLIQLCFAFLRIYSLKVNNKFRRCLYKLC